jgi:putative protease
MSQPSGSGRSLSLPLVGDAPATPEWEGLRVTGELPEPQAPQGEYNAVQPEMPLEVPDLEAQPGEAELLAPAGGIEAAFAAFHFGADAVYLGLKKFSARAEAENFSFEELDEITAYAHSLEPRRRVFVTINTLLRQDELPELVECLVRLDECGVDAVILQDLGVYRLLQKHFPAIECHASTQLAVHNGAGAMALRGLGFRRVVLARELTFEEVRDITSTSGIETEVFIHGALCYSYSGLCLFSSQTLGRSGNRGKCAYSCRDSYTVADAPTTLRDGTPTRRDPGQGFPFSMKDLALPDHLPALRAAGVSCFKVEGRKKSPLYVATTTEYYRKLLDGTLDEEDRPALEADMQTVFSRPWTRLFVQSHQDKEVADRDTVGHRGTRIGVVESVTRIDGEERLRFRTSRALERHDGLQVDLPTLGKPFGFAIEKLWVIRPDRRREREYAFQVEAGTHVEVALPSDHPPLAVGAPVYCSSSQAVKQKYRHDRPRPEAHRTRWKVDVTAKLTADVLLIQAQVPSLEDFAATATLPGPFSPAREPAAMQAALRGTFEKLGGTAFELGNLTFENEAGGFVPVSKLNALRRDLLETLEAQRLLARTRRIEALRAEVCPTDIPVSPVRQFAWSLKVDRIGHLAALEESDLAGVEEIVVDVARDHPAILGEQLEAWGQRVGRDRLRLALPALTRRWEAAALRRKIDKLREAGWTRWEAANLSAWSLLDVANLDLATDWSVYVVNRLAAEQLLAMGVKRFALSPEDGLGNLRSLLGEFGEQAVVIVHQDTPQFLAESCAYANLIGGCPGKANCKFESMHMVSSHGERVLALDYHCRTIVLNEGPFCLSRRLPDLAKAGARHLRADFIYRPYTPEEVRQRWRLVRAGQMVPGGHAANFDRGLL